MSDNLKGVLERASELATNFNHKEQDLKDITRGWWKDAWDSEERIYCISGDDSYEHYIPILDFDFENIEKNDYGTSGIDTLAFYISFHFTKQRWGIYLLQSGINLIASEFMQKGLNKYDSMQLAEKFLIRHELGHFQLDFAYASVELATGTSLYVEKKLIEKNQSPFWNPIEEGLCNSLARRTLGGTGKLIDNFLNNSPVGYRDWNQHTKESEYNDWGKLLEDLTNRKYPRHTEFAALNAQQFAKKYFSQVPIYHIYDIGSEIPSAKFMGAITQIHETVEFKKDLKKLSSGQPRYEKQWIGAKKKLASGNFVGVHLEKIREEIYTVRIDGDVRAALNRQPDWSAFAADHHDPLYRRISRI